MLASFDVIMCIHEMIQLGGFLFNFSSLMFIVCFLYHAGSRTPHYGSETPRHEGSQTPGRTGAWDPTVTDTPMR